MMGGQIDVQSEEGKGSTFCFTAEFAKQPGANPPEAALPPWLQGAKALVVDDNDTNRALVARLLRSWGLRPEQLADGRSTVAILRHAAVNHDPFRLALLDKTMPGIDWDALGQEVAADPELRHTALAMMCSFGRHCEWPRLQTRGYAGHIPKPIWEPNLREALLALAKDGTSAVVPASQANPPVKVKLPQHDARILIAEDNLTNQEVALAMLKRLGYQSDVAANGREAIEAVRDLEYDLVLMDCEMPEIDGYEATRQIRQLPTRPDRPPIPIIALTADAISGDRERCLEVGMDDYLSKPVEPHQLAAVLEKWLAKFPHHDPPERPPDPRPAPSSDIFEPQELRKRLAGDEEPGA